MTLKQKIYDHLNSLLDIKILSIKNILNELSESAKTNSKSSAGDKHETAQAMIHIEQESISKQLNEVLKQKDILENTNPNANPPQITKGSLVKSNRGYLFLSIAYGKITIEGTTIIVISPQSPLGLKLAGLKTNDLTEINGVSYIIEGIS